MWVDYSRRPMHRSPVPHVAVAVAFFVALTVESFWLSDPFEDFLAPAPLAFCVVCALALGFALRAREILLSVYIAQAGLAYSFGSVRASHEGASVHGLSSTPASVASGLILGAAFIALVSTTALVLRSGMSTKAASSPAPDGSDRLKWFVALLMLGGCFLAAIASGAWTYYSGVDAGAQETGGIRLELLYGALLPAMLMLVWQTIVARWSATPGRLSTTRLQWALLAVLLVLEFVLQTRRLMMTSFLFCALVVVQSGQAHNILRTPIRKLAVASAGAFIVFATFFGTNLWRNVASEYGGEDLSASVRLSLMAENVRSAVNGDDRFASRMTYLGLNSAAFEYLYDAHGLVSLPEMASSSFVSVLPGVLFPWKYGADGAARVQTCESAFEGLGYYVDLPCTPEAEAMLAGGPLGVVLVAVLWGTFFAWVSRLLRRPGFLPSLAALVAFIPMSSLETSAFPMFMSLRMMVIIVATVWCGAKVIDVLRLRPAGRRARAMRPVQ